MFTVKLVKFLSGSIFLGLRAVNIQVQLDLATGGSRNMIRILPRRVQQLLLPLIRCTSSVYGRGAGGVSRFVLLFFFSFFFFLMCE